MQQGGLLLAQGGCRVNGAAPMSSSLNLKHFRVSEACPSCFAASACPLFLTSQSFGLTQN